VRSDLMSGPRPSQDHGDGHAPTQAARPKDGGTAAALEPLLDHFFGGAPPVRFEFWDGTSLGPPGGQVLEARSADGVRRLLWAPGELGLARAFVEGDLSFRGDLSEMLALLHAAAPENVRTGTRLPLHAVRAAYRLGVLGRPHSKGRDAQAARHHCDVSNVGLSDRVRGGVGTRGRFVRP